MSDILINQMMRLTVVGRFFRWLFRRQTQGHALVVLAALVTLVAAFYLEENWRGKRAWENCKREFEARGYVLDWNKYIPPPVPEDQNFFDAPKMAEWFVGRGLTDFSRRLQNDKTVPAVGEEAKIKTQADARNYLNWSEQFGPDFDLIREALTRPYARINGDYTIPYAMPIPNFVTLRAVAQILAQRAHCYLLLNQPQQAFLELTRMHDLCRLLKGAPTGKPITLVAAMINVAVHGLYVSVIQDGFRLKGWQESQLTELQKQCEQINLCALVVDAFHTEPAATTYTLETISSSKMHEWFSVSISAGNKTSLWQKMVNLKWFLLPRGWIYQNMVTDARLVFQQTDGFDSANNIMQPKNFSGLTHKLETIPICYKFIALVAVPNFTKAWQTTVHHQAVIDEAQIVCALERYHLVHGQYPETLDALAPQFIENLPHDIIGGQPLRYRRMADPPSQGSDAAGGKFLLYSVGWNQMDDGGVDSSEIKNASSEYAEGDWVWQYQINH